MPSRRLRAGTGLVRTKRRRPHAGRAGIDHCAKNQCKYCRRNWSHIRRGQSSGVCMPSAQNGSLSVIPTRDKQVGTIGVPFPAQFFSDGRTQLSTSPSMRSIEPLERSHAGSTGSRFYRPGGDARHWAKAALVVRIIFQPSASRLAISCPLRAVIPHATL